MLVLLRPEWLWLLLPGIGLIILGYYLQTSKHHLHRLCDPKLLPKLLVTFNHRSFNPLWLLAGIWLLGILALAGPSWSKNEAKIYSSNNGAVILLDLSADILVKDVIPNRLVVLKQKIRHLLNTVKEQYFALVVFAGDAFVVSPVTNDLTTIDTMLNELQPDLLPVAGKNIASALQLSKELLLQSGYAKGDILLFTAGNIGDDSIGLVNKLTSQGFRVSAFGIGAQLASGNANSMVNSNTNYLLLQKLVTISGGMYQNLTKQSINLDNLTKLLTDNSTQQQQELEILIRQDDGYWFLWLLLPLVILLLRQYFGGLI